MFRKVSGYGKTAVMMMSMGLLSLTGAGCGGEVEGPEPVEVEGAAQEVTTDVAVLEDTFVRSDDASPGTGRGGWNYLAAKGGTPAQVTYLKFNLAGQPSNVTSARLRLYCYDGATCGGTVTARQVTDDAWVEGMTWFNKKPLGAVIASASVAEGWVELNVTGFVNAQLAGDKTVTLALEASGGEGVKFRASESTTERPVLRIDRSAAVTQWWRRHFVNGKSRHMGRNWNVGPTFYNTGGNDQAKWNSYMGAQADVHSGSLVGGGTRVGSWAEVAGGDLNDTVQGVMPGSQMDLGASDHMRYWVQSAPQDTWGVFAMTTVPFNFKPAGGTYVDGWEQVANGAYDAWYFKMGQRMRWYMDNRTNKDHRNVVLRPNWEFNQDTGFKPGFFENRGYVKLYNRMMKRFADNFRAGYGYNVPIAFSPAARPACLPLNRGDSGCTARYADFFEFDGVYQMADVSYHPSNTTAATMAQVEAGLKGREGYFTLAGEVLPLARSKGLAISVLEWSPRNEPELFSPLADVAVHKFADLLEANKDIVSFTCAHHDSFINEGYLSGNSQLGPVWRRAVQAHRARFGKQ